MNYCIVAFGVILFIAVFQWIIDGRKNYHGPHLDVEGLTKGAVEGITGIEGEASDSGTVTEVEPTSKEARVLE